MTTTGSGSGDFFEYKGVQTCQVNIDKKFKELAECLKGANDYMNAHIDTAADETAIKEISLFSFFLKLKGIEAYVGF